MSMLFLSPGRAPGCKLCFTRVIAIQ